MRFNFFDEFLCHRNMWEPAQIIRYLGKQFQRVTKYSREMIHGLDRI